MRKMRVSMEQRMKNRRFHKTEDQILSVFSKISDHNITITKIAKRAGIGRSTMYQHHHTIREVLPDYRKYIISTYRTSIKKSINRKFPLRKFFLDFLVFIMHYKKFFKLFFKFHDTEALKYMLKRLRSKIENAAHLPKNSDKIFAVYTGEIIQIIETWSKSDFSDKNLESVLSDIIYLTETCRDRLMPINHD